VFNECRRTDHNLPETALSNKREKLFLSRRH
jgi:hypothetical protein